MVALRPLLAAWWGNFVLLGAGLWGGVWLAHPFVPVNFSGLHQFPFWPDPFAFGMAACALGLVGSSLAARVSRSQRFVLRVAAGVLALASLAVALPYVSRDEVGAIVGLLLLTLQQALLVLCIVVLAFLDPVARWRLAPLALAGAACVALGTFDVRWPRAEPLDDDVLLGLGHALWAAGFAVWSWPHRLWNVHWHPEAEGTSH